MLVALIAAFAGCSSHLHERVDSPALCLGSVPEGYAFPQPRDGRARPLSRDTFFGRLARFRAILIGERHDRLDHHVNQLEVLCELHARGVSLAVGFEAFHQPFQPDLDAYVAGEIDLAQLLERTEYYTRWRFDHRLYTPLFRFARNNRLPMVALNVPREVTRRLGDAGFGAVGKADSAFFPHGLREPPDTYRERNRTIFSQHRTSGGATEPAAFDRFVRVQWMWDEAMAQRSATFLHTHPSRTLVVIAGSGHVAYAAAIPARMAAAWSSLGHRPLGVARVLQGARRHDGHGGIVATHNAAVPVAHDIWLTGPAMALPPMGRLGVFLDSGGTDVSVSSLAAESSAGDAGIKPGDRLVSIAGTGVKSFTEVKLVLAKYRPGDTVSIDVIRPAGGHGPAPRTALTFDVRLH